MAYSVLCYAAFQASFLYFILFLNNLWVPKGIDNGASFGLGAAVAIDVGLVLLWGVQHSVMARGRFKQAWTRVIPAHAERATYVLASAVALAIVMIGWVPVEGTVWSVQNTAGRYALWGAQAAGWALLLAASFEIDHFELFGLKQAWYGRRGEPMPEVPFRTRAIYRAVRHPIQTGVVVGMWCTPDMTASHALFAGAMTGYVLIGLYFEERDLTARFGEQYRDYRRKVAKLIPFTRYL